MLPLEWKLRRLAAGLIAGTILSIAAETAAAEAQSFSMNERAHHYQGLATWVGPPGAPPGGGSLDSGPPYNRVYRLSGVENTPSSSPFLTPETEAPPAIATAPFVWPTTPLIIESSTTLSEDVRLTWDGVSYVHAHQTFRLSGNVNSNEYEPTGLVKYGPGLLVVSGDNQYVGKTQIYQGGLHVEGETALGASSRDLDMFEGTTLHYGNGAVVFDILQTKTRDDMVAPAIIQALIDAEEPAPNKAVVRLDVATGTAIQRGVINGPVDLAKTGLGTLVVPGSIQGIVALDIHAGTLRLDGNSYGPLRVHAGATLTGQNGSSGPVTVHKDATFAPGYPGVGEFTVLGDLRFEPGARLEITALPTGESDRVNVLGKAYLAGDVYTHASAGDWKPSTRYTIIQTVGGIGEVEDTHFVEDTHRLGDTHFVGDTHLLRDTHLLGDTHLFRFDKVHSDLAFLTPTLEYDANAVHLVLARNDTPLEEGGGNPGDGEIGDIIEEENPPPKPPQPPVRPPVEPPAPPTEEPNTEEPPSDEVGVPQNTDANPQNPDDKVGVPHPTSPLAPIYEEVVTMTWPEAEEALHSLSASSYASVASTMLEDSRFVREAALQNAYHRSGAWAHAFKAWGSRGGRDGVSKDKRDLDGIVMGVSRPIGGTWSATGFVGAQQADWHGGLGLADSRIRSTHAGLALSRRWSDVEVAIGIARTWHALRHVRRLSIGGLTDMLTSEHDGRTWQWFGEVVAPLQRIQKWASEQTLVQAYGRLALIDQRLDSAAETGGPAALHIDGSRQRLLLSTLGLRAQHPIGDTAVHGELEWQHAWGPTTPHVHAHFRDSLYRRSFRSTGLPVSRDAIGLNIAAHRPLGKHGAVALSYAGQYARRRQDHGAKLNLRWAF